MSPVPTSYFVCTANVMICPVFGWTSCRWLPLPVLASTNPAAFNRRISSPHVTQFSITERLVSCGRTFVVCSAMQLLLSSQPRRAVFKTQTPGKSAVSQEVVLQYQ